MSTPLPIKNVGLLPKNNHTLVYLIIKTSLLSLLITIILLSLTGVGLGAYAYHQLNVFTQQAGITNQQLWQLAKQGMSNQPIATNGHKNILILGTDKLETRGNAPALTDSIMIVSLNLENGLIKLLPFPRDIWSDEYQTKINALYSYGINKYPDKPQQFPTEVLNKMTNLSIHHTVVVSMEQVAQIINLLGKVKVDIPIGFTDTKFPRSDVDVTIVNDPALLYETVVFQSGQEMMSGDRALQYIRSRNGDNDQNTDQARSIRQQLIIKALLNQLLNKENFSNPTLLGQLYQYYQTNFLSFLPIQEIIATVKKLIKVRKNLILKLYQIPIKTKTQDGVLEHPPQYLYDGQWVYIINDEIKFKKIIQSIMLE